ncbi:UNVERIFIED_CONTAM: hypothetical protein Sindi_1275400 [Sesamum indicum]
MAVASLPYGRRPIQARRCRLGPANEMRREDFIFGPPSTATGKAKGAGGSTPFDGGTPRLAKTIVPAIFPTTSDVRRLPDVNVEVAPVVSDLDAEVAIERSADISPTSADVISAARADVSAYSSADVIHCARADVIHDARADVTSYTSVDVTTYTAADVINPRADISSFMEEKNSNLGNKLAPVPLFIGNIPLHTGSNGIVNDKIVDAFNNSSQQTLSFIAPTKQNGEVVARPSLDTVRDGSKRWKSTAVGYLMGKRPYYHHLKEFAHSVWPALREVIATANGFFFFQFKTEIDIEEVIEGGPWLFQGQSVVLQKWEPGMAMRKLKHTQVPVLIKLRHLPLEFWTTEGLSTVASGVGKPLNPDAITRACTRLDFARVCVMIDITQKLEKHITIVTPDEDGGETPCKTKPPVKVYVPKANVPPPPAPGEREKKHKTVVEVDDKARGDEGTKQNKRYTSSQKEKVWNVRGLNKRDKSARSKGPYLGIQKSMEYLETLAREHSDEPWLVGGDFNAVREMNEVCGASGDIRMAMEEFNAGIQEAG